MPIPEDFHIHSSEPATPSPSQSRELRQVRLEIWCNGVQPLTPATVTVTMTELFSAELLMLGFHTRTRRGLDLRLPTVQIAIATQSELLPGLYPRRWSLAHRRAYVNNDSEYFTSCLHAGRGADQSEACTMHIPHAPRVEHDDGATHRTVIRDSDEY